VKRFVEGDAREQSILLPASLDDYVDENNSVRVLDVFVAELDLGILGFTGVDPEPTGRPSYHPAALLKIYLYGYLNRIQSSRRLERECQRNVELMWLVGRLKPDFKTIADFRKDNGAAIRAVCRQFVELCRQLKLFALAVVAIDGSKFKAVNNRDRNYTSAKVKRRLEQIEESIARYLSALDTADRQEAEITSAKAGRLNEKIEILKQQMQRLRKIEAKLKDAPDGQISLTDPDARSMATSGRGTGIVGYNVQTAVDAKHHLIVAHEVTNVGNDRAQLASMAGQARNALGSGDLEVLADRGYFKGEEILACEQAGITPFVLKPLTSGAKAAGRFDSVEHGMTLRSYWTTACSTCAIKAQCTTGKERRIKRWEHEAVIDAMQARLDQAPEKMGIRRQTVEHPFGTIKAWMGSTHFLTRTLDRVSTEMSLHVLAYNLKRVIQILGAKPLMDAIQA
jgi:transposase